MYKKDMEVGWDRHDGRDPGGGGGRYRGLCAGGDEEYPFDFAGKFKEGIANILGISVAEYDAAVEQAQDQVVDKAVTEGWLSERQAGERATDQLDNTWEDGFRGFGGRHTGMMGFPGPRGEGVRNE